MENVTVTNDAFEAIARRWASGDTFEGFDFRDVIGDYAISYQTNEQREVQDCLYWVLVLYAQEAMGFDYTAEALRSLPRGLRAVGTTNKYLSEVMNGGLSQLFENVRNDGFYEVLLEDLEWIEAHALAAILRAAHALARSHEPTRRPAPEARELGEIYSDQAMYPVLDSLDDLFGQYGGEIPALEEGWLRRLRAQPDAFLIPQRRILPG